MKLIFMLGSEVLCQESVEKSSFVPAVGDVVTMYNHDKDYEVVHRRNARRRWGDQVITLAVKEL